jgi:hypothetical protein
LKSARDGRPGALCRSLSNSNRYATNRTTPALE